MKKFKNSNSVVLLSMISLGVSACGQNPNVNSKYFAPIQQNGSGVNAPAPSAATTIPVLDTGGKSLIPKQDDTPPPPITSVNMGGNQLPNLPAPQLPKVIEVIDPHQPGKIQRPDNTPPPAIPTGINMGGNQLPNLPAPQLPKVIEVLDPSQPGKIQRPDNTPPPAIPTGINMGGNQLPNLPAPQLPKVIQVIDPSQPGKIQRPDNTPPPVIPTGINMGGNQLPNLPAPQPPKVIEVIDPSQPGKIQRPDNTPPPVIPTGINMGGNQLPNLPAPQLPKVIEVIDPSQPGKIQRPDNTPPPVLPTGINMGGDQLPNLPAPTLPRVIEVIDPHQPGIIQRPDDTPPPLPSQPTGLSGDPLPNLPPPTLPIVVLKPQDGQPGKDGKDGKDGQDGCGVRAFSLQFPIRPFTDAEKILYAKELPYRSTMGFPAAEHLNHKIPTLQIGEMTGMNDGMPFVANSQIEMAVDVALPPADAVVQVQDISLRMYVSKLSQEQYTNTELLCFLDERICSGALYRASNWLKNINQSFFTDGKPANENFVRAYTERQVGSIPVYRNVRTPDGKIKRELVKRDPIYASGISLPIADIVSGSGVNASQLVYGQAGANIASDSSSGLYERTLHIVVADDTYVREDAEMVVTLTADTCKMPNVELKAK